jgi:hypothetical protein
MTKPWLKKKDTKTITVEGVKITLKSMSFGESRKAMSSAMSLDPISGKATVDASLMGVSRTVAMIADWELTDENDEKLPVSLETFDELLDEEFAGKIIEAVTSADNSEVTDKEKK